MNGRLVATHSPGGNPRELGRQRRERRRTTAVVAAIVFILLFAAYLSYLTFGNNPAPQDILLLFGYMVILVFVTRIMGSVLDYVWQRETRAVDGAIASEKISALLQNLPADHVVLHDLDTGRNVIDHLIFRKDGAIFLIETQPHSGIITEQFGELLRDGRPFEQNILRHTNNNVYWLQQFLKARLGSKLWINSAIVFPEASIEIRGKVKGVQIISAVSLKRWMWRSGGNPYIAAMVWPHIKRVEKELIEQSEKNLLI